MKNKIHDKQKKSAQRNIKLLPLKDMKFVLLDMDGTLLDRYFDDYFWEHLVPEKYAEKYFISFGMAKEELMKRYKIHEGTLRWTDLDFWSDELDLNIPALKEQIYHLIEVHPHVEDFLKMLRKKKKKIFLVTNAHYKSIDLKLKKTRIGRYFNSVISSFDIGYPKETLIFWEETEKRLGIDKNKTLFIDDSEEVLSTAKKHGIKIVCYKARSNSKIKPKKSIHFYYILDFDELIRCFK